MENYKKGSIELLFDIFGRECFLRNPSNVETSTGTRHRIPQQIDCLRNGLLIKTIPIDYNQCLRVDGESFIGGFASGFLARGFHIGYGLYFTSHRLIGIDVGKNGAGALGGTMAGFIDGQLTPNLSPEESDRVIGMLDGMKDFELLKEQIRSLELHKVGLLGSGHFVIVPGQGEQVKISLRHRTAYDRLMTLTQRFGPELVKLS